MASSAPPALECEPCESEPKRRRTLLQPEIHSCALVDWLQTGTVSVTVEVADGSRKDVFYIHGGCLRLLPYFEAYTDRWAKGEEPCKLQLPPDVDIEDFQLMIARIYTMYTMCTCASARSSESLSDLRRAVAFYLLVDMLLADQLLHEAYTGICVAVRTAEQLQELRTWSRKPGAKALSKVVTEIESEREEPFLATLVRSVIGDGNRVLGSSEVLDLKTTILRDRLKERADVGLQGVDAHNVLEVLRANAWIGTVYYDQTFKVSPKLLVVWQMVEPYISTETGFAAARGLANELDRPAGFNHVSYRGEQRYSLAFSNNRELAVQVLQGIVRVGASLAEKGMIPWNEVMTVLPRNYESAQLEAILQPAMQVSLFQVELLLPHLKRLSMEFLAKLLRTAPRAAARKIARHVFLDEAALKPNKDVFETIRELKLV